MCILIKYYNIMSSLPFPSSNQFYVASHYLQIDGFIFIYMYLFIYLYIYVCECTYIYCMYLSYA